ncbi:hypothetical protein BH11PLA1_BH11PLA1_08420 [soil metagenome]
MLRPSFSTVAAHDLPLDVIAARCKAWGFLGIDLRTFGDGSRAFACDPALTSPDKIRRLFSAAGVRIASLSTSTAFDDPIRPQVIGNVISDTEGAVREAKRAIDLAISLECPLVRVFAFELKYAEPRVSVSRRIVERLKKVIDHAHRTGVRIMLENGGSYSTAVELIDLIDAVNSPLLGACYNVAVGQAAGDIPGVGVASLADRLLALRIKDLRAGRPVALDQGDVTWRPPLAAAASGRSCETAIYEWDRAWIPGLAHPDAALPEAARTLAAARAGSSALGTGAVGTGVPPVGEMAPIASSAL